MPYKHLLSIPLNDYLEIYYDKQHFLKFTEHCCKHYGIEKNGLDVSYINNFRIFSLSKKKKKKTSERRMEANHGYMPYRSFHQIFEFPCYDDPISYVFCFMMMVDVDEAASSCHKLLKDVSLTFSLKQKQRQNYLVSEC